MKLHENNEINNNNKLIKKESQEFSSNNYHIIEEYTDIEIEGANKNEVRPG